eukprot:CAMPEP_0185822576 /NCGR_PEP_ID=MMETSP1322-20130828/26960_1 /TAXON_ID=265543 /ORGANISM="Minutocellus polymorphus, Strain RCC2270" /LENGTH=31 /DNA_ID= /DNA_START= /DNA_END= /DNA_ORIENTATION=
MAFKGMEIMVSPGDIGWVAANPRTCKVGMAS